MPPRNSRRDFLLGRAAADAAADLAQQALDRIAADAEEDTYLLRVDRRAMACRFELCLNVGQYAHGTEAALAALDELEPLEEQLSYFRSTSEISRINQRAAVAPVRVRRELFQLLELCQELHQASDGAFDITAAPLWKVWGFARREGAIPGQADLDAARSRTGMQYVELDPHEQTVRFLRDGIELNLGSIGKGFALDACGRTLRAAGVAHFLFHGGGSSILAGGSRGVATSDSETLSDGRETSPRGWVVGLLHPARPEGRIGAVRLRDRAIGTSGSRHQSFRHAGRRYGHILDPRTGQPAEGVLSVTVVAPTATLADALSTAFFVMGPEAAEVYCQRQPQIGAIFFLPGRGGNPVEVISWNIAREDMMVDS